MKVIPLLTVLVFPCIANASPFFSKGQRYLDRDGQDGVDMDLQDMRLVEMEGQQAVWMTEYQKLEAKRDGVNYFDITDTPDLGSLARARLQNKPSLPQSPNATELVRPILDILSEAGPRENLAKFTSFRTRYYKSQTGRRSQLWLLAKISETTSTWASQSLRDFITISEFPHEWGQNTIIVRIEGSSTEHDGVVILGAHQDSINMWPWLPAPGADDDGSGTVTILEAYRALLASDFRPIRPVEFHWYSAEEGGLLGSQAVAHDYEQRAVSVLVMSQFDMTAWVKRGTREEVGIITDFTDERFTKFNKQLVETYLDIPYVETKCGYACSDHASWRKAGYPSVFTIESTFENSNQNIHSARDRIDISDEFKFSHMLQFSKLAVAFAVELGVWKE